MAARKRRGNAARGRDPRLQDIQSAPRERWSHGGDYDVVELDGPVAARRVQRVSTAVDGLRRSGRIGDVEVAAAARWLADYERNLRSSYVDPATAGIRAPGGSNSGPELRWLAGVDAATRRQQVRAALGREGEHLLIQHVHLGLTLRTTVLAETGGVGGAARARAADELAATLKALSAHYSSADRWGRDGILRPRPEADGPLGMAA